jgi:hypothetical protein
MVFLRIMYCSKIVFILSLVMIMGVIFFSLDNVTKIKISRYFLFSKWNNFVTLEQKENSYRKPSYPWIRDVHCRKFTVQVSNTILKLDELKSLNYIIPVKYCSWLKRIAYPNGH